MVNFNNLFKQSLKHCFRNYHTYIMFSVNLAISILLFLVIPFSIGLSNMGNALTSLIPTLFITLPFYCSMVAETNANREERTFILSRPIKRKTFLLSKLASAFVLMLCLYMISIVCIIILYTTASVQGVALISGGVHLQWMLISILFMCMFGSIVGTCFAYYLKNRVASMIVMVLCLALCIPQWIPSIFMHSETFRNFFYNYLPMIVFAPLSAIGYRFGLDMMKKTDVGV